jgi:Prophage minor tail protein Z (GPZ)
MVTLSIKTDFKDVQAQLNKVQFSLQGKVISAALNKVATKAKTQMTREIAAEFNLKQNEINPRLRINRARRDVANWSVTLDPFASSRNFARKGSTLNLIRFIEKSVSQAEGRRRAKQGTKNQLHFQIKKTGRRVILRGAFVATNQRTGGTAVFARTGKGRYPIEAKQTIDIPQMFNTRRINARVVSRIQQELPIEFDRAIRAVLSGNIR